MTSSLLRALVEGAAEPSTTAGAGGPATTASPAAAAALTGLPTPGAPALAPAALPGGAAAGAAAGAALATGVLPVAVSSADQRSYAEAARSPAVSASLASKEAPEAGAAELAAAAAAQPESLDATAEYLSERDAARSREGQGLAAGQVQRGAGEGVGAAGGMEGGGEAASSDEVAGEAAEAGRRLRFQVGWRGLWNLAHAFVVAGTVSKQCPGTCHAHLFEIEHGHG